MSDITLPEGLVGVDAASATLDAWIKEDQAKDAAATAGAAAAPDAHAPEPDRGASSDLDAAEKQLNDLEQAVTPTTAEQPKQESPKTPKKEEPKQQETKQGEQAPATTEPEKTRYQKSVDRREKSWAELNQEKELFRKAQAELDNSRKALETERKAFESKKAEAEKQRFSVEDYDKAAEKFEADCKFDLADAARNKAAELRKNPPKAASQLDAEKQQQFAAQQKEWFTKAAIDFPSTAKQGSPEHQALQAFVQAEPDVVAHPKGLYYGARLVAAETAAARVPALQKELEQLQARVKEFEALTGPSTPGVPGRVAGDVPWNQKPQGEQLDELEQMARGLQLR
jgi:hypothetical protein